MSWLERSRSGTETERDSGEAEEGGSGPVERAAPGVAELFRGLRADGSHVVLDLGAAEAPHFRLYSRFARRIRFAGLLPTPPHGAEWRSAVRSLPPHPGRPYDVVLMWNLLDRLSPKERPPLVERLAAITAPGARLYVMVDASDQATVRPLRFTLLDLERLAQEPVGPPEPARERLLPAELEHLLDPFEVTRAFTLRVGFREYVAVKRGEEGAGS